MNVPLPIQESLRISVHLATVAAPETPTDDVKRPAGLWGVFIEQGLHRTHVGLHDVRREVKTHPETHLARRNPTAGCCSWQVTDCSGTADAGKAP